MIKDFYEILGVTPTANLDEIKKAHRKLAKMYHPDLNPNNKDTEEKFKEIQIAYETLSDSQKRAAFDFILEEERIRNEQVKTFKTKNSGAMVSFVIVLLILGALIMAFGTNNNKPS